MIPTMTRVENIFYGVWCFSILLLGVAALKMERYLIKEKIISKYGDWSSLFNWGMTGKYYKATKKQGKVGIWYKVGLLAAALLVINVVVFTIYQIYALGGFSWNPLSRAYIFNWKDWLEFLKK